MNSITTQSESKTLPYDSIFEILTRTHLDDLPSCRQVNRDLYKMTNEPNFKIQHCVKTHTASGYIIQYASNGSKRSSYYSFVSDYPITCPVESLSILKNPYTTIEAVSQCRGLICCFNGEYGKEQYYVCKPATGQCKTIPNPNLRFRTAATAIIVNTAGPLEFKIIRFSIPNKTNIHMACKIFDSRIWTWRRSKNIKENIYLPSHGLRETKAMFVCGSLHWLVTDFSKEKIYVFAFNVENESWKLIDVPQKHLDFEKKIRSKITIRDGKLCYVILKEKEEMVFWIMERSKAVIWWRKEVLKFKEAKLTDGWLEFYMEFVYSNKFGAFDLFLPTYGRSFGNQNSTNLTLKIIFSERPSKSRQILHFANALLE